MEVKSSTIIIVAVYTDGKYTNLYIPITEQMNIYDAFLCVSYPSHVWWLLESFSQRFWIMPPKYVGNIFQ